MEIKGTIFNTPNCRIDEKNRFKVYVQIKDSAHFVSTYMVGGRAATTIYNHFSKGNKITLYINRNNVVYRVIKAN